jgi:hypothetical protein
MLNNQEAAILCAALFYMDDGRIVVKILRNRHAWYCITEIQICRYNLMQFPVKRRSVPFTLRSCTME